jgi:hypothetical protein
VGESRFELRLSADIETAASAFFGALDKGEVEE